MVSEVQDRGRHGGGGVVCLGVARLAAVLAGVSWVGVAVLVAIAAMGLIDPPGSGPVLRQPPPFGWVTTVSCACAVVSLVTALLVLTLREAGSSAVRLGRRVRSIAPVAFLANCFVWYLIAAFVYSGD